MTITIIYYNIKIRAIFNWLPDQSYGYYGFALLCSEIGVENLDHPLTQSDANSQQIMP